jgi:hypothetical protein
VAVANAAAVTAGIVTSTDAGGAFVAGLFEANTMDEIPGVGEVIMVADVATGLYLGGDYVVHHWAGITHGLGTAASTVGHATVGAVHEVGHLVSDVTSWF